jgi:oligopeptide transport system ATP-binding protein
MSALLEINGLKQHFIQTSGFIKKQTSIIKAIDGVDFNIDEGETLGLVGESGCGKSTLGRTLLRLIEPVSGQINFMGQDITHIGKSEMRALRQKMQIIFQDPFASLNPRMSVGSIIEEAMIIHKIGSDHKERQEKILDLLSVVGLRKESLYRYPHEFSGGQRQRIGIARALAVNPKFIVCDEPISALDVSIQAQIINLMQDLQYNLGLTYLFIAHDLHVVKHIASRIAVMYLGNIVEIGDAQSVFNDPKHPYTQALLSSVPNPIPKEGKKSNRILLSGEVPSPINPPSGCKFHTRCRHVMPKCKVEVPKFIELNKQKAACFLYE